MWTGFDRETWTDPTLCVYYMKDRSCTIVWTGTGLESSQSQMARSLTPYGRLTQWFLYFSSFSYWYSKGTSNYSFTNNIGNDYSFHGLYSYTYAHCIEVFHGHGVQNCSVFHDIDSSSSWSMWAAPGTTGRAMRYNERRSVSFSSWQQQFYCICPGGLSVLTQPW